MQEHSFAGATSVFLSLRPTTKCYNSQQPIEQRNPTQLMRLFICRSAPMSLLPLTWWDSGDRCNQIHKQSWIFPSMLPPSERSPGEETVFSLIFHRPDDFWSFTTRTVFDLSPLGWFGHLKAALRSGSPTSNHHLRVLKRVRPLPEISV